jgi:hypothetical protein
MKLFDTLGYIAIIGFLIRLYVTGDIAGSVIELTLMLLGFFIIFMILLLIATYWAVWKGDHLL